MSYENLYSVEINEHTEVVGADSPAEAAEVAQKQWVLGDPERRSLAGIESLYVKRLAILQRVVTKEKIDYGRRKKQVS